MNQREIPASLTLSEPSPPLRSLSNALSFRYSTPKAAVGRSRFAEKAFQAPVTAIAAKLFEGQKARLFRANLGKSSHRFRR